MEDSSRKKPRARPTEPKPSTESVPTPGEVTLDTWVHQYWLPMMRTQVKPSTFDSYRRNLDLHVLPHLGEASLPEITPLGLNGLYAWLLESGRRNGPGGLSPKTVHYLANTIHKVLADAVDAELIISNPAGRARAPRPGRVAPVDLRFWEPEQLRHFLKATRDHPFGVAWRLAAMTGMRRGEVLGLRWSDVSLDRARLAVRHTIISIAYRVTESTPKTHQARVIDLDAETVRQLRAHREQRRTGNLVFCRPDGSPIHPQSFTDAFGRAVAEAGLPASGCTIYGTPTRRSPCGPECR